MTARRRAAVLGLGAAVLYLALAAVSGRLSPLARRPLLDGFAPPPPYRWVKPPHNLAPINKAPLPGRFTIPVLHGVAGEGLFATRDSQASVLMVGRSIVAPAGTRSVELTLDPQAPRASASLPKGRSIIGNVYAISAAFEPSGSPVRTLNKSVVVTLVYPALAGPHIQHRILASTDGKRFTELASTDSPVLQQITAHSRSFGLFAVGVHLTPAVTPAPNGPGFPVTTVVVAVAAAAAVAIGWLRWRARRAAAVHAARGRSRTGAATRGGRRGGPPRHAASSKRPRRRPGRSRDDPWRW